jgi:hypothetical protein
VNVDIRFVDKNKSDLENSGQTDIIGKEYSVRLYIYIYIFYM